ncbi:MAG: hypothetical protein QOH48_1191 [Actinomycetota bacterium]|nr:hypothetical protein [Actinomycetota bacterium]
MHLKDLLQALHLILAPSQRKAENAAGKGDRRKEFRHG